ncbi:hypothetical protein [Candidatus Synechococcus spongiarum]|uniref:hypothetical protein n=1 Tax=Candidatus Synechococcus spongiarum TaxID=431041 RepID=UPI001C5A32B0|nr:hypothetical protein [Candidatus Synechococcus spongiarum]
MPRLPLKAAVVVLLVAVLVVIVFKRNCSSEDRGQITASEVVDRKSLSSFTGTTQQ